MLLIYINKVVTIPFNSNIPFEGTAKVLLWNMGSLAFSRGTVSHLALLSSLPFHYVTYYRLLIWVPVQN